METIREEPVQRESLTYQKRPPSLKQDFSRIEIFGRLASQRKV